MTYKFSVTPEAANDLPHCMEDPKKKLHHTSIETYQCEGVQKEYLRLHYELVGYEFGKDYTHYSIIEMPMDNVLEFLKFTFRTIADGYELSHSEKLPGWEVKPVQG